MPNQSLICPSCGATTTNTQICDFCGNKIPAISMTGNNSLVKVSEADMANAYFSAYNYVKSRLKSPASSQFPSYNSGFVSHISGNNFEISTYYDAQNSFGAMLRGTFKTIMYKDGNNWFCNYCELDEEVILDQRYRSAMSVIDSNGFIFPELDAFLRRNVERQKTGFEAETKIGYGSKNMIIQAVPSNRYNAFSHSSPPCLLICLHLNERPDLMNKFQKMPVSSFFSAVSIIVYDGQYEYEIAGSECYAIDCGDDHKGAAELISYILIQLYGVSKQEQILLANDWEPNEKKAATDKQSWHESNRNNFEAADFSVVKQKINSISGDKLQPVFNASFRNPTNMLILAIFNLERFWLGSTFMGLLKLALCFFWGLGLIWWFIDLITVKKRTYKYNIQKFSKIVSSL
ncbi:MAG: TM2 domain-containing protein [Bacteroidales bacterium]|jgi:hypothetical protein|nr:TM2 domain-containing protein [Bacteroidales bacterium]